jgi:hypothetical protein
MEHKHSDTIHSNVHELETTRLNALKKESTISLIRRIIEDSDTQALRVFHETRTLFYSNEKWVRLAEFVRALRDSNIRGQGEDESKRLYLINVTDEAYDLTLAKFNNIPSKYRDELTSSDDTFDANGFTWGVDCRLYFKQLLKKIDKELSKKPIISETDIEDIIAKIAKRFVIRHFYISKRECERRDTISIRYAWEVKGRLIYLFYPSHLTAKQFRKWLEDNIKDVNPDAPHEKNRIQEIIDQKYPRGRIVPDDDPEIAKELGKRDKNWLELKEGNQFLDGFRVHIAKEKSENLEELRPAIKILGKEGVYNLVNRIFTDMADEQYNLSEVARNFNLSKATLSRFAGSDWLKDADMEQLSKADIPDLWINTARVLAGNPTLMEVVKYNGLADIIDDILAIVGPQKGSQNEEQ